MSLFGNGGNALGSNAQSQSKPGLSIAPPQAQPTSSLFAQQASTPGQQSGGLFGSAASSHTQAAGSSLFGNATSASQPAQQSSGANAFAPNNNSTQPPATSSLFGNPAQSQQRGNLFGSSQAQQPSLFGSKPAGSLNNTLFGQSSSAVQPDLSLAGTAIDSQRQQQNQHQSSNLPSLTLGQTIRPQQVVPGVRIDASNIRSTTRFNDLHEDIQSQIEKLDTFIQQQIQFKEQCDAMMPNHESNLKTIPEDVVLVNGLVDTSELGILNDSTSIKAAKDLLQNDADTARISFRAIETLKLPSQLRNQNTWYSNAPKREMKPSMDAPDTDESQPQDVVDYFAAEARNMTSTLHAYEKHLSEIESHLQNVESNTVQASRRRQFALGRNGSDRSADDQIRELAAVLKEFEGGIYGVAAKIGEVQDETQKLTMQPKRRG